MRSSDEVTLALRNTVASGLVAMEAEVEAGAGELAAVFRTAEILTYSTLLLDLGGTTVDDLKATASLLGEMSGGAFRSGTFVGRLEEVPGGRGPLTVGQLVAAMRMAVAHEVLVLFVAGSCPAHQLAKLLATNSACVYADPGGVGEPRLEEVLDIRSMKIPKPLPIVGAQPEKQV